VKELRAETVLYLPMEEGETQDDAELRLLGLLDEVGIECSYGASKFEERKLDE